VRGFSAWMLRLLSLLVVCAFALPAAASAATADLDPNFGTGGQVRLPQDRVRAVALQPDGKLVLVTEHLEATGRIYRLNPDGTLDRGFGDQGVIAIDDPSGTDQLRAVVLQPDGKITVGGSANNRARLYRFDAQGRPDQSFGASGVVALTTANVAEHVYSLALAPDGKLVAAGDTADGLGDAIVWRRHGHDGSVDATFNNGGRFHFGFAADSLELASSVTVQPDGRILLAGNTSLTTDAFIARLDPVLGFDKGFRGEGKVRLDVGASEFGVNVVTLPNGKIVVAGRTTAGFNGIVWQMLPSGAPDMTFNDTGVRFVDSAADETIRTVLPQPDGKLVLVGATTAGAGGGDAAFYRLTEFGAMDTTFEGDGAIGYDSGSQETMQGAVLQGDGNIVGVGTSGGDGIVYRLLGDPHLVTLNVNGSGHVVSDPPGLNCPGQCAARFDSGSTVRLRATPQAGFGLTGWFGVPCAGFTCSVEVHGPTTVGADFFQLPVVTPPVVSGGGGPGPGSDQDGGGGRTPPDTVAPRITRAWIFGRTVNFRLSERARVTATVKRGKKTVTRVSGEGRSLKLRKRLARGRYAVELVAVDAARNRSAKVTLRMRVR